MIYLIKKISIIHLAIFLGGIACQSNNVIKAESQSCIEIDTHAKNIVAFNNTNQHLLILINRFVDELLKSEVISKLTQSERIKLFFEPIPKFDDEKTIFNTASIYQTIYNRLNRSGVIITNNTKQDAKYLLKVNIENLNLGSNCPKNYNLKINFALINKNFNDEIVELTKILIVN